MNSTQHITEAELMLMQIIWNSAKPLNSIDIREQIEPRKSWNKSTTFTLLTRLVNKGYLKKEKRGVYYFIPLFTQEEYEAQLAQSLLDAHYQGSARKFISALYRNHDMSLEELDELIASLKRGEA